MARQPKEYVRLPGRGQKVVGVLSAGRTSLWLGNDHLLHVSDQWFTETYKRFYFRDIQAIMLRKTRAGKIINLVCGLVALLVFLFPLAGKLYWAWDAAGMIVGGCFGGFFLLIVVVNSLMGPTSSCKLKTAVQSEELPSLARLWRARKVLRILRARIDAEQGVLSQEEIASNREAILAAGALGAGNPLKAAGPPELMRHCDDRFHAAMLYILLFDGVLTIINIFIQNKLIDAISACVLLGGITCMTTALFKQQRSDLPSGLKNLTWATLAYTVAFMIVAIGYGVILALENPGKIGTQLSPFDHPVIMAMDLVSAICDFSIGGCGVYLLQKFRRESAAPDAQP